MVWREQGVKGRRQMRARIRELGEDRNNNYSLTQYTMSCVSCSGLEFKNLPVTLSILRDCEGQLTDTESKDRRVHRRVPFVQEVEVEDIGIRRCSDISVNGMYLESVSSILPDSILHLTFRLNETDTEPIRVTARVLYQHESVGVGLNFISLSPTDRDKLEEYVQGRKSDGD